MRAGSVPEEFQQPMAHSGWWLVLALALLAAVVLYYLAVIVLTRRPAPRVEVEPAWVPPARDVRGEHLAEIDRIERAVGRGDLPARGGHQHLSRTVRDYVAEVSQVPADKMVLADLKAKGVDTIACIAINDAWVMDAWGKSQGADGILMLADGNGEFTKAMDLVFDGAVVGLGTRSQRYAAIIEDGVITQLDVEEKPGVDVSSCESVLTKL